MWSANKKKSIRKESGDSGELEVVKLIRCPNCDKKLMLLPPNYPLYDVQCTACAFRAQIKTANKKPAKQILGAGWDILDKVLKSGFLIPPILVNYKWSEGQTHKQEIRFYPFIPKKYIRKSLRDIKSRGRKYWMFNYVDLDKLVYFPVHLV